LRRNLANGQTSANTEELDQLRMELNRDRQKFAELLEERENMKRHNKQLKSRIKEFQSFFDEVCSAVERKESVDNVT